MSAYAEYKYAKTEEEREDAMRGIRFEVEKDMYWEDMYEHEGYDEEEGEEWD